MAELVVSGRAAHQWEDVLAALMPLQERFRAVYFALHQGRDEAMAQAREALAAAGVTKESLSAYECQGFKWAEEGLKCAQCSAPLKELYLQTVALPNLARELRKRLGTKTKYDEETPQIRRLRVAEIIPKPRIENEADLEEALDALRAAVTEALDKVEVVELG